MSHAPIFVLRHGETVWNTELRLQGSRDSPLTARGRTQALRMGTALRQALAIEGHDPATLDLVASPLGRTSTGTVCSSRPSEPARLSAFSLPSLLGFAATQNF